VGSGQYYDHPRFNSWPGNVLGVPLFFFSICFPSYACSKAVSIFWVPVLEMCLITSPKKAIPRPNLANQQCPEVYQLHWEITNKICRTSIVTRP
jgi:hypothetical protein